MPMQLTGINRYPVKSCRGEALTSATVEPWGLGGDRRWMIVDDTGNAVTAREYPQLLLVQPELVEGGVLLRAPGLPGLSELPVAEPRGDATGLDDVTLFRRRPFTASVASVEAHAWVTAVVGRPSRLVFQDDPTRRPTSPDFTEADDCVSLADGYPVLIATEESLAAVNDAMLARSQGAIDPLPMIRFRPNLVVRGAPAWAEDGWRRIRIGAAEFRAVKGCDRCVLTTIDPDTAVKGKEPIATLARIRRFDGLTWFGMNLVPDTSGVRVQVGDPVDILESVPAPDGPPR